MIREIKFLVIAVHAVEKPAVPLVAGLGPPLARLLLNIHSYLAYDGVNHEQ